MTAKPLVLFFKDIDKDDLPAVGGKGANLGEITQAGFPVPNGFAVTVASYELFIEQNNLAKRIDEILANTNVNNPEELQDASKQIGKLIVTSDIPDEVVESVHK